MKPDRYVHVPEGTTFSVSVAPTRFPPDVGSGTIKLLSGATLDLVRPSGDVIDWQTVAAALARMPRFTAQTVGGVLSVAQHSEQGARAVFRDTKRKDLAAAFLIHDAHEAFIGDDATPKVEALVTIAIEEAGDLGAGEVVRRAFKSLKDRLDAVIYPAAGLPWPLPEETQRIVKEYDARMGRTERLARTFKTAEPEPKDRYSDVPLVLGVDLHPWHEGEARERFLDAFRCFIVDSMRNRG